MAAVQVQKHRHLVGVVVNAGARLKTIRVRVPAQKWNDKIKKNFSTPYHLLVNDPAASTRPGDIVQFRAGWRVSKHIHHVVTSIVTPFGPPLADRAPVPSEAERVALRAEKRVAKDERQAGRGRAPALQRLRLARGLVGKEVREARAARVGVLLRGAVEAVFGGGHWARSEEGVAGLEGLVREMVCVRKTAAFVERCGTEKAGEVARSVEQLRRRRERMAAMEVELWGGEGREEDRDVVVALLEETVEKRMAEWAVERDAMKSAPRLGNVGSDASAAAEGNGEETDGTDVVKTKKPSNDSAV